MADRFGAFLPHDTSGDVAQLHGIGLQKFGDTWYAYGENKVNGNLFQGVCCYTTTDFIAWRSHGIVLDVQEDGSALASDRIGERPKVLHCPATGKYVMYIHAETPDYGYAHIGVAVADAPTGPFAFQTTITWRGYLSRDIGVFQDEDGSGYIMSEDRDLARTFTVSPTTTSPSSRTSPASVPPTTHTAWNRRPSSRRTACTTGSARN